MRASKEAEVCIILPAWNAERYVGETIESVLRQSFSDFRLLVLDNASDDATPDIVRSFGDPRIELVRNAENLGFVGNLNLGLSMASGRHVATMNADDLWAPDFLARCREALDSDPDIAMVHTAALWIDSEGRPYDRSSLGWPDVCSAPEAFLHTFRHGFTAAATLMRTDCVKRVGSVNDPRFAKIADTELFLRLCLQGKVAFIREPLVSYRVHDESVSLDLYGSGAFFRMHRECARAAFDWPETRAAGAARHRKLALRAVAQDSLRLLHVLREHSDLGTFLRAYRDIIVDAPDSLLTTAAWSRLALGLLPAPALRALRRLKRRATAARIATS